MTITLHWAHWMTHALWFVGGAILGAFVASWIIDRLYTNAVGRAFGW